MATFTNGDVLREASITLKDKGFVHWTLSDLNAFLNAGVRQIALEKPNAVTRTVQVDLAEGAQQTAGSVQTLMRVVRNTGGAQITPVEREQLDAFLPGWPNASTVPYSAIVQHVIYDPADPLGFMVYPGNDGTGSVDVLAATVPDQMSDGATPDNVSTYTQAVPNVPNEYRQALVDYVLYRAYSIDMELPGAAPRAQFHLAQFQAALGSKLRTELAANPDTTHKDAPEAT